MLVDNRRVPTSAAVVSFFLPKHSRRPKKKAAPWIGLAVFSLAFCGITTYGRGDFGIELGVLFSRYTTHELLLSVAVIALGYLALPGCGEVPRQLRLICFSVFLSCIGILIVLGYADGFYNAPSENQSRRQAKELLPFLKYFDPRTDGDSTGPLYVLLQLPNIKVYDLWYKTYLERYINAVENAQFVDSYSGLYGRCSVPVIEVAPGQAMTISGEVHSPSGISPEFVFLREQGKDTFVSAAQLHKKWIDGYDVIYNWDATLASQLIQDRKHELEMWIYDKTSNAFLKVEQRYW